MTFGWWPLTSRPCTPNVGVQVPSVVSAWVAAALPPETRVERWPISAPPGPTAWAIAALPASEVGSRGVLGVDAAIVADGGAGASCGASCAAFGDGVEVGAGADGADVADAPVPAGAGVAVAAGAAAEEAGAGSTAPAGWARSGPDNSAAVRSTVPTRRRY